MLRTFLAVAMAATFSAGALAQASAADWPQKPVKIVVPFSAGGSSDTLGRGIAQQLQNALKQSFVIENKGGGGGTIGSAQVAKSAPDGYTLVLNGTLGHALAPMLRPNTAGYTVADMSAVGVFSRSSNFLVVAPSLGVKSVKELIDRAKAAPGKISFSSAGLASNPHLGAELFKALAGVDLEHIPYKGGADLAADLIEGRVQVAFDAAPAAINNAKSGKTRIIAVAAPTRSPFLPDVPTTVEQGVKDIDIVSFLGWFGPKGMAPDVVRKLNAALVQSIAQPSVKEFYNTGAYTAESSSPELLAREVKDSYERWGALVKKINLQKQ